MNRTDPTGMDDGGIPDQNIKEVTVTGHDGSKDNSSSSSAQFIDDVSRNISPNLAITPPMPTFNLPINTSNQQASGNQKVPKNKQLDELLAKINKILTTNGFGAGVVSVVVKNINGVPEIAVIFKEGGALAALGSIGKDIAAIKVGAAGVVLTFIVDGMKLANGNGSWSKTAVDAVFGTVGVFVPEVGLVYIILDHYGVIDGAIDLTWDLISDFNKSHPSNFQNPVCPQDKTKLVRPGYSH